MKNAPDFDHTLVARFVQVTMPQATVTLRAACRFHPKICKLVSAAGYNNELVPGVEGHQKALFPFVAIMLATPSTSRDNAESMGNHVREEPERKDCNLKRAASANCPWIHRIRDRHIHNRYRCRKRAW